MSSSIFEPADEPGSLSNVGSNPPSSPFHYSTETYFVAKCDLGLGVFANRTILPGEIILAIEGPLIDFAETKRRGPRECMALQMGDDLYIDTQAPGVLVNHSCNPNAGIKRSRYLVALQPILEGQQICYDYSTTMEEGSFTMVCRCGDPRCRKVVRDFSTLPTSLREKYLTERIVMKFIEEKEMARKTRVQQEVL
jgi:uncharacterized protein